MSAAEPQIEHGWVQRELALELPGLALASACVTPAAPARATADGRAQRLAVLADRLRGAQVVALRTRPVVAAQRSFFRQVGLDPDVQRTPIEEAALGRMLQGGFVSRTPLDDALLIALLETAVGVWALDDARVHGALGLAMGGEGAGARLVVADATGPVAAAFGAVVVDRRAGPHTRRLRLFAIQVPGVPAIAVEEALWTCAQALVEAGADR